MTILDYIKAQGLTPRVVCKKIGVTKQALSDYSNAKYGPTLRSLTRIADAMTALGVPTTVAELTRAITDKDKEET